MAPPPKWLFDTPFAHRGLHDQARGRPENSIAAFAAAISHGYGIELDVQVSKDNEAMVFHDPGLGRVTAASGQVKNWYSADLEKLELGAGGQTIPRLTTVLKEIAGRVPLLVEIKNKSLNVGRYEYAVTHALEGYRGAIAILVWNPWSMKWLRRRAARFAVGHIVTVNANGGFWKPWYLSGLLGKLPLAPMARPDFMAHDVRLLPSAAAREARRSGMPVLTWAVRSEEQKLVAAENADNIIFEGYLP